MRFHTITFTIPEAAEAFASKAMIRSLVHMDGVIDRTVHMSSNHQLETHHTKFIQGEAETQFGFVDGWKFNFSDSPIPRCGDCWRILKQDEIENGFCDNCLESAVGE